MGAIWSMVTLCWFWLLCPTSAISVPWESRIRIVPVALPMLLMSGSVAAA